MSSRAFQIPISARTTSTIDSYRLNSSRSPGGDAADTHCNMVPTSPFESLTQHLEKDIDSNHIARNSYQQPEMEYSSSSTFRKNSSLTQNGTDKNLTPPSPNKANKNEFRLGEESVLQRSIGHGERSVGHGAASSPIPPLPPFSSGGHSSGVPLARTNSSSDHPVAEEYIESVNGAATKIQQWYKGQPPGEAEGGGTGDQEDPESEAEGKVGTHAEGKRTSEIKGRGRKEQEEDERGETTSGKASCNRGNSDHDISNIYFLFILGSRTNV